MGDVSLFAGQVVAYQANSYYFNSGRSSYSWDPSPGLLFGYVSKMSFSWIGGVQGYEFTQLLLEKDLGHSCAFTDVWLKDANMSMRLATPKEIEQIRKMIDLDIAKFSLIFDKQKAHNMLAGSYGTRPT